MIHILMFRPHNVIWDKGHPHKIAHGSANIQAKSIIRTNYHSLRGMLSIMLYRVIHDTMGVAETHSITKRWKNLKELGS